MRTTLAIDDDVLSAARSLAEAAGTTVGQAISDLARRGLQPRPSEASSPSGGRGVLPVFSVPSDASPITLETVRRALDDD